MVCCSALKEPDDGGGNYQVRSLAGAGGANAYLEDGLKAARRLMAAKAVLEQFDVILTSTPRGLGSEEEMLLKEGLALPEKSFDESTGFPFDEKVQAFRFNPVNLSWPMALELRLRNYADRELVSYARRLQRLDRIYFEMGQGQKRAASGSSLYEVHHRSGHDSAADAFIGKPGRAGGGGGKGGPTPEETAQAGLHPSDRKRNQEECGAVVFDRFRCHVPSKRSFDVHLPSLFLRPWLKH
eukprot:Skav214348  [mRNA]  locus=scaffold86:450865:452392:+ [translate_table: standard]